MAQSPTHKFGQIIGDLLEQMLRQPLEKVARRHGLYLDFKHARAARENRRKVTWTDHKGNTHDLDYVLELGGSEDEIGSPKAFIESAWRRYTKHSRNKAQEIQGAVSVLAETYSENSPFLGIVLAGVFTEGSLRQLRSHGFSIVYCPYEKVIRAFSKVGIDAAFDENTPDADVQAEVQAFLALDARTRLRLVTTLRKLVRKELDEFVAELNQSLTRRIERIVVATLHGPECELLTVSDAIAFIDGYDECTPADRFVRYEVDVRYSNGDRIAAQFAEKATAIAFLSGLT